MDSRKNGKETKPQREFETPPKSVIKLGNLKNDPRDDTCVTDWFFAKS